MHERCNRKTATNYKNYGGRGISICKEWYDFKNFYDDMIVGYETGLELDRENNNGNYEKSNCRWVTPKVNARNRRPVKLTEEIAAYIRNSTKPRKELMIEFNVCKSTIGNIKAGISWT